jgi:hypothetical protein
VSAVGRFLPLARGTAARCSGWVLGACLVTAACTDEFPLGAWDAAPNAGGAGSGGSGAASGSGGSAANGGAGAAAASGGRAPTAGSGASGGSAGADGTSGNGGSSGSSSALICNTPGVPGAPNQPGGSVGTTDIISDFVWPAPMDSLEWDLLVERELERDGYYWMNQVSFTGDGTLGYFGMQERGGYYLRPDPAPADVEFTKMVVFWVSSPGVTEADLPDVAELGDIQEPDGRALPDPSGNFITIHAKFDWEYCTRYRLRLSLESIAGDLWIGGFILDVDADVETFFGRIKLPAEAGQFVPFNSLRTTRVDRLPLPETCPEFEHTSALFGLPTANLGTMVPDSRTTHFPFTTRCGTSRYTLLENAIRHELAVER